MEGEVTVHGTGDPSSSSSERWELHVTCDQRGTEVIRHCDLGFGMPGTTNYALVKGKPYTFRLKHVGSTLAVQDDHDYCALVNGTDTAGLRQGLYATGPFFVEDPDGLLTELTHGHDGDPTLGKTGKIHVPGIGFRTNGVFRAEKLIVAKWENAFIDNNGVSFNTPDFINSDVDRFQVFLYDHRRTEPTLNVTLTQDGSIAGNRTVTVYRQQDGTYLSTNLLLVADAEDRDGTTLTLLGASPDINHRLSQTALDDTLSVNYSHNGISLSSTASVGVDVKTLYVDVAVMTTNGVPCATLQQVTADMKAFQESFAQANVKVVWTRKPDFPAPSSIVANPTDWATATWHSTGLRLMTPKTHDVITSSGLDLGNDRARVIYVPHGIKDANGLPIKGVSFADWAFPFAPDKNYIDTCFVTAVNNEHYIVPHEVAHLFDVRHEPGISWNLIYPWPFSGNGINDPKRLMQEQVDKIREDVRNKLK